jgi:hypothetical protein
MALGGGIGSLLTLHNAVFFSGLLGLATYMIVRGRPVIGVITMCIAFTPPLLALLGVVWKDVGMGAALLLMTAMMLWAQALNSRWLWIGSLVPAFYAIAVRHNGVMAVAPMLWFWCPSPKIAKMGRRRIMRAFVVSLGMLGINAGAVRLFATRNDDALVYIQGMYDLIGIAANGGKVQWPDYVMRASDGRPEDFVAKYSDVTFYASPCPYPNGQVEFGQLKKTWLKSIVDNPGPYAVHRLRVFRNVIGLGEEAAYEGYYRGVVGGPDNVTIEPNGLYGRVMQYVQAYSDSLFYRPIVWLGLALAALWLSWKRRLAHRDLATCLVASAILYTAPNLIVICGTDFRYMWWPTLALMIAPLLVLSDAFTRTHPDTTELMEEKQSVVGA